MKYQQWTLKMLKKMDTGHQTITFTPCTLPWGQSGISFRSNVGQTKELGIEVIVPWTDTSCHSGVHLVLSLSLSCHSGVHLVLSLSLSCHSGVHLVLSLSLSCHSGVHLVLSLSLSCHSGVHLVLSLSLSCHSGVHLVLSLSLSYFWILCQTLKTIPGHMMIDTNQCCSLGFTWDAWPSPRWGFRITFEPVLVQTPRPHYTQTWFCQDDSAKSNLPCSVDREIKSEVILLTPPPPHTQIVNKGQGRWSCHKCGYDIVPYGIYVSSEFDSGLVLGVEHQF